jgi:hypothetical protein
MNWSVINSALIFELKEKHFGKNSLRFVDTQILEFPPGDGNSNIFRNVGNLQHSAPRIN